MPRKSVTREETMGLIGLEATDFLIDCKNCAYVSAEERIDFLKVKADRIGVRNVALANMSVVEDICEVIQSGRFDVMVIDSLQELESRIVSGEGKTLKYAGSAIIQAARKSSTIVFVVCHSTTTGRIKGGTRFPHQCDADMRISRAGGDTRVIWTEKNRMGRTDTIYLDMGERGYDYHTPASPPTEDGDNSNGRSSAREEMAQAIMDTIENSEDGAMDFVELGRLCKEEDLDIGKAEAMLREMVATGEVCRSGTRRHNFQWTLT